MTVREGVLEHKSVSLSLRAPRIAVLFRKSEKWREAVQLMLAHATKRWGGQQIILVPHDETGHITQSILRLLEQFDPDYIAAPDWGIGAFHNIWPIQIERDGVTLSGDELSAAVEELDERGETHRDPISEFTEGQLARTFPTLRTYATDEDPLGQPRRPDLEVSLKNTGHSTGSRGSLAVQSSWTSDTSLMCGAMFGVVDASSEGNEQEPDWASQLSAYIGILGRRRFPEIGEDAWNSADPPLNWMQTGYPGTSGPIILGDTADDFCMFLLLQRMRGHAYWLPTGLISNLEMDTSTASYLQLALMSLFGNDPIKCHSVSVPHHEFESNLTVLNSNPLFEILEPGAQMSRKSSKALRFLPSDLPELDSERDLFIEGSVDIWQTIPVRTFGDGRIVPQHPPVAPLPSKLPEDERIRWVMELSIDDPLPPGRDVSPRIFTASGTRSSLDNLPRRSRRGLAWAAESVGLIIKGSLLQYQVAQPAFEVPSLLQWVGSRIGASGYTVEFSAAGQNANLAAQLVGGRSNLIDHFNGPARSLFEMYRSVPPKTRSDKHFRDKEGVLLGGEPYLSWRGVEKTFAPAFTPRFFDELAATNLITRGFVLDCLACPHVSFIRLEDMGRSYRCPRCGEWNALSQPRWRDGNEPAWFYDIHPSVRELVNGNGDLCLRAAAELRSRAKGALDIAEMEIRSVERAKAMAEVDLMTVIQGRVFLTEAKVSGQFQNVDEMKKKLLAARILGADVMVLATSKAEWKPADLERLTKLATADESSRNIEIEALCNL